MFSVCIRTLATIALCAAFSPDWAQFGRGPLHDSRERLLTGPQTGASVTLFLPTGRPVFAPPCSLDVSTLIVPSANSTLTAVDAAGAAKWTFRGRLGFFGAPVCAPSLGLVFAGDEGGYVYALNASTGAAVWTSPFFRTVFSNPTLSNGVLFFGSDDHFVNAMEAATGAVLWRFPTNQVVHSSPAVFNGTVIVGCDDLFIYALDAAAGTLRWKLLTNGSVVSSPSINPDLGVLYVGGGDKIVRAVDVHSGTVLWQFSCANFVDSTPAQADFGNVVVGSYDGHVYKLSSTGALIWRSVDTGNYISASPLIDAMGNIYIANWGGQVFGFSAAGAKLWAQTLPGPTDNWILAQAVLADSGTLLVGGANGLYRIADESPQG